MIGLLPVLFFVMLLVVGILILVFVPLARDVFGTIRHQYYPDARSSKKVIPLKQLLHESSRQQ